MRRALQPPGRDGRRGAAGAPPKLEAKLKTSRIPFEPTAQKKTAFAQGRNRGPDSHPQAPRRPAGARARLRGRGRGRFRAALEAIAKAPQIYACSGRAFRARRDQVLRSCPARERSTGRFWKRRKAPTDRSGARSLRPTVRPVRAGRGPAPQTTHTGTAYDVFGRDKVTCWTK